MNLPLSTALYALVSIASLWLALLWLWSRRGKSSRVGKRAKILAGVATVSLLFVPIDGMPLWNRAFSFYTNPSLPMLGIVCAALWQRLFGLVVFQRRDWWAIWIFGAVAGSVLYLHPMVFGALDLYYWGWDRAVAAWMVGGLAVVLFASGSRLGVLLLAALIGFAVSALESRNCWDYVMDPIYWLASLGVLTVRMVASILRRIDWFTQRRRAALAVRP
ncbi:MAG: hypothetical protein V4773_03830 [Verrucomicrobiota bacterium]